MIRLNIIAEGQTEESFVKNILCEHLGQFNISTDVRRAETGRRQTKIYRGGVLNYEKVKKDIEAWLKQDKGADARFTTMFDLYALPDNFPKFEEAKKYIDPYKRIKELESAFKEDIGDYRFLPYLQLHEFEALILSDPSKIASYFIEEEDQKQIQQLIKLTNSVDSPELINDGKETAPSKRIIQLIPAYEGAKVPAGYNIVKEIGLQVIRDKCPHFNEWLIQLENLS